MCPQRPVASRAQLGVLLRETGKREAPSHVTEVGSRVRTHKLLACLAHSKHSARVSDGYSGDTSHPLLKPLIFLLILGLWAPRKQDLTPVASWSTVSACGDHARSDGSTSKGTRCPEKGQVQGLPTVTRALPFEMSQSPVEQELELRRKVTSSESPPGLPRPCPGTSAAPVFPPPRHTLVSKVPLFLQSLRAANPEPTPSARLVKVQVPHGRRKATSQTRRSCRGRCRRSHSAGPWTWWRLRLHSQNRAISFARPCCHSWVTTNLRGPPVTRASGEPRLPSLPPTVSRARLQNGVETHM